MDPQIQQSTPFSAGSHVVLQLTDGTSVSLQIIKPFLPFTKSQVYLVRPDPPGNFPPEIILKIFDPRYLDDRIPPRGTNWPSRLWTLEAETAAARYRQEITEKNLPDNFTMKVPYGDEEDEPYLYEEYFYRLSKGSWKSEVNALSCLISLQGTAIPKLYGSGSVLPQENTRRRSIQPLAVIIEYIHGTTLADLEAGELNVSPALFRPLFDAVNKFGDLGVFHADINAHNILVSPSDAPTRAVLIDFGCAGVRDDRDSEEDWTRNVEFFGDERSLRRVLKGKGIARFSENTQTAPQEQSMV